MYKTVHTTVLFILAALLAGGAAIPVAANDGGSLSDAEASALLTSGAKAQAVGVDCDAGESLERELRRNQNRSTFWIVGDCVETQPIVIERSGVTLRGLGGATLTGPGLVLSGAQNVLVRGLGFRQAGIAITVGENSQAGIYNATIEESQIGILVDRSVADLTNISVIQPALAGIIAEGNGPTYLNGNIVVEGAGAIGMAANSGGMFDSNDPELRIEVSGAAIGIVLQINAKASFIGGEIITRDNAINGLLLAAGSTFAHGTTLVAENNGDFGLAIVQNSNLTAFQGLPASATSNGNTAGGLLIEAGSAVVFGTPLTVADNDGPGIFVDDAGIGVFNFVTAENNGGGGLLIAFGSNVTFGEDNDFGGPVSCQGTVFTRGTDECTNFIDPGDGGGQSFSPGIGAKSAAAARQAVQQTLLEIVSRR